MQPCSSSLQLSRKPGWPPHIEGLQLVEIGMMIAVNVFGMCTF
jgi:hypothetical protein